MKMRLMQKIGKNMKAILEKQPNKTKTNKQKTEASFHF